MNGLKSSMLLAYGNCFLAQVPLHMRELAQDQLLI
jgi:hypothetical protein